MGKHCAANPDQIHVRWWRQAVRCISPCPAYPCARQQVVQRGRNTGGDACMLFLSCQLGYFFGKQRHPSARSRSAENRCGISLLIDVIICAPHPDQGCQRQCGFERLAPGRIKFRPCSEYGENRPRPLRSVNSFSNSSVDGSIQCRSSTMNNTGCCHASACNRSSSMAIVCSFCCCGDKPAWNW